MTGTVAHGQKRLHAQSTGLLSGNDFRLHPIGPGRLRHRPCQVGGNQMVGRAIDQISGQADGFGQAVALLRRQNRRHVQGHIRLLLRLPGPGPVKGQRHTLGHGVHAVLFQQRLCCGRVQYHPFGAQALEGLDALGRSPANGLRRHRLRVAQTNPQRGRFAVGLDRQPGTGALRLRPQRQPPVGRLLIPQFQHDEPPFRENKKMMGPSARSADRADGPPCICVWLSVFAHCSGCS